MVRTVSLAGALCAIVLAAGSPLMADSMFRIENPPLDYEVVDAYPFDGTGDFGPFDDASSVLLGYRGEAREIVEFDISGFQVPGGEYVSAALFQAYIADDNIGGLGIAGITPSSLACHGYVGNGVAELSDFEAGDANFLARYLLGDDPYIGQQVTFDVTDFVRQLVAGGETWVGLTVRAEQLGGVMLFEGPRSPMLTIWTMPVPEPTSALLLMMAAVVPWRPRSDAVAH